MRNGCLLLVIGCLALPVSAAKVRDINKKPNTIVVRPAEPTVTLDEKDVEARVILKMMQKQCGVKNVIVDPQVPEVKGTFLFKKVPCSTAFKVVLQTLGLDSVKYSSSFINVTRPK